MHRHRFLRTSTAFLIAAGLASGLTARAASAQPILVFETIAAPLFAEKLPSFDFLLGTLDDVAAAGLNVPGTANYTRFTNINPLAGTNVHAFFRGTFSVYELPAAVNEAVSIVDFDVDLMNQQTTGPETTSMDLKKGAHMLVFGHDGSFALAYTIETCSPFGCVETDESRPGYWLRAGEDPFLIPDIPGYHASYLQLLSSVAPDGWTAIAMAALSRVRITSDNTRGPLAGFFLGGFANGITALATTDPFPVPEPGKNAQALIALVGLAALRARRSGCARIRRRPRPAARRC